LATWEKTDFALYSAIQVVLWALGQKCPLKQGVDWANPATAIKALSDYRTYSRRRKREGRGFGVFGDVCVTSVTSALPGDKNDREWRNDDSQLGHDAEARARSGSRRFRRVRTVDQVR
jgi:hypothetical protein